MNTPKNTGKNRGKNILGNPIDGFRRYSIMGACRGGHRGERRNGDATMKTANETMTAADALKHQMDAADIVIARCKKMISDLDDRLRSQSHDICKYMNSLSGSSIACSAGNIVAFAAQMQAAASELQAAQDWKRDAAARLEWING